MLRSALDHYERQQRLTAAALIAARRRKLSDAAGITQTIAAFQLLAADDAAASIDPMLEEQGINAPPLVIPNIAAVPGTASDGRSLVGLIQQATSPEQLGLMVVTQVQDAARTAAGLSIAVRHGIGYVRMLNPPSCARCVVLAGKFYRHNDGFQRHPRCDCRHIPATENTAGDLRTDPDLYFEKASPAEQLHLAGSKANLKAINDGSDLGQIVNAYRRTAGMQAAGVPAIKVGSRGQKVTLEGITTRGRSAQQGLGLSDFGDMRTFRMMPETIYKLATDEADLMRRLRANGWVQDQAAQNRGRSILADRRRARRNERRRERTAQRRAS